MVEVHTAETETNAQSTLCRVCRVVFACRSWERRVLAKDVRSVLWCNRTLRGRRYTHRLRGLLTAAAAIRNISEDVSEDGEGKQMDYNRGRNFGGTKKSLEHRATLYGCAQPWSFKIFCILISAFTRCDPETYSLSGNSYSYRLCASFDSRDSARLLPHLTHRSMRC